MVVLHMHHNMLTGLSEMCWSCTTALLHLVLQLKTSKHPTQEQVVKVTWHKAASPPHTDGSIVFARWHQCSPLSNIWFPGHTWLSIPNCISISTAVFAQITAGYPCTLEWTAILPLKIAPLRWGIWTPSNTQFFGPTRLHNPNTTSIGSAVFVGLTITAGR